MTMQDALRAQYLRSKDPRVKALLVKQAQYEQAKAAVVKALAASVKAS